MSDYSNLENVLSDESSYTLFRRIYFKRRAAGGGYETDWQLIPEERIASYGQITYAWDKPNIWQISSTPFTIKLYNNDGYYNDASYSASFFNGCVSRYKTLVKIEAGYINSSGNEIPSNPQIFIGFLTSNFKNDSGYVLAMEVSHITDIFKLINMADVADSVGLITIGAWWLDGDIYKRIRNYTSGGYSYFQNYIPPADWRYHWGLNSQYYAIQITATADVQDLTVWDGLAKTAEVSGHNIFMTPNGKLYFTKSEPDYLYSESDDSSAPSELILYNTLNQSLFTSSAVSYITSTVGPKISMTSAITTTYFSAARFDEGLAPVQGKYGVIDTTGTTFNFNKFTIEFWAKCNFDCTAGVANQKVNIVDINDGAGSCTAHMGFGYKPFSATSCALNFTKSVTYYSGVQPSYTADLIANTSTFSFESGTTNFFSFVHDSDGIEGTNEILRIYWAGSNGAIQQVAAFTHTANADFGDYMALQGIVISPDTTINLGNADTTASQIVIDNLKIYDYAKITYSANYLSATSLYSKKQKHEYVGLNDINKHINVYSGAKINTNYNNVLNHIVIRHDPADTTSSYFEYKETWAEGDSSSSDLYGVKKFEADNDWYSDLQAQYIGNLIYTNYKDAKTEAEIKTLFYPWSIVMEKVRFTYQSPVVTRDDGTTGRTFNITNTSYKIVKAVHDLDKLESKLTLREV